jgi:hypothetical protein
MPMITPDSDGVRFASFFLIFRTFFVWSPIFAFFGYLEANDYTKAAAAVYPLER